MAALIDWAATLGLIFGGCCSNALTLEQITADHPGAGSLITFAQFLLVALYGLPQHLAFAPASGACGWRSGLFIPRLKQRRIPLPPYLLQVALFYAISLLNNAAFAYSVPMSVHIIFRSGGLVVSMALGWLVLGRRYNATQITAVLVVTTGVLLTTLSASSARAKAGPAASAASPRAYASGIAILSLALLLSGFLGLVQDRTYTHYGRVHSGPDDRSALWQESMFYLHFLSLPMFLFLRHDIATQLRALHSGPALHIALPSVLALSRSGMTLPAAYAPLALNALTQLACVAGVNQLTGRVSSLSVTLVLVVRKAASLVLSVLLLGGADADARMLWTGAALVLLGTIGYSFGSAKGKERDGKAKDKAE